MKKKRCTKCEDMLFINKFYAHPRMKDGHLNHCITCHGKMGAARRKNNLESVRIYSREYQRKQRKENPEKVRQAKKDSIAKNPEHHRRVAREAKRRQTYGITHAEYLQMVAAQNGLCALCKNPPTGKTIRTTQLHVDHCHKTGKIRGLLCVNCNRGLGYLKDDVARLQAAIMYLQA